jgi:dihydroflavonol-4-reductase
MKIAVTGASGRIGNVVVRDLLEAGHAVRVLQRRESRALAGLNIERVQGELLDQEALTHLTKGTEVLIHLAAVISLQGGMGGKVNQTNVDGTRAVLKAAQDQGLRRAICFSSIHAYNQLPGDTPLDETRALAFQSKMAYDRSKAEALSFSQQFAAQNSLEVLSLCPTSVIGPFDFEPSLSGQMFRDLYHQKIPLLVPGGFDWCDVRDIAGAAVSALQSGRSGEAYLLPGRYATLIEMAQIAGDITGKSMPDRVAPDILLRLGAPFVAAWAKLIGKHPLYTREALDTVRDGSKYISGKKAALALGYSARPLETTIADTYQWLEQNGYL